MEPLAESLIRMSCFGGVLLMMAVWELCAPRRPRAASKPQRWFSNLALAGLNTLLVRLLSPLGLVGVAVLAEQSAWGVLNHYPVPSWLAVLLAVLLLDLVIYLQHVLFHAVPLLWRLHMVHHADLDCDVTTGIRFHSIEILLSLGIKSAAVVLLGAPVLGVLIFEVLLNATSMFNHGNVRMPAWLDWLLRRIVVTPDMHRVHHSVVSAETNSNFGFNLPWWDYLFGTYQAQPAAGHQGMTIGLEQFRDERVEQLPWMLALPFVGQTGGYPVNRGGGEEKLRSRAPGGMQLAVAILLLPGASALALSLPGQERAAARLPDEQAGQRGELQGVWVATHGRHDGQAWSPGKVLHFKLAFHGQRYTLTAGDRSEEGGFRRRGAATLDLFPASGPLAGSIIPAIFQVEANRLVLCLAPPGQDRPGAFCAAPGTGRVLIVLRPKESN